MARVPALRAERKQMVALERQEAKDAKLAEKAARQPAQTGKKRRSRGATLEASGAPPEAPQHGLRERRLPDAAAAGGSVLKLTVLESANLETDMDESGSTTRTARQPFNSAATSATSAPSAGTTDAPTDGGRTDRCRTAQS